MISEGSCDTEDWSNAENSAFNIFLYIWTKTITWNCTNISFYCIFDQINAVLVGIRDFQKH